MSSHISRHRPTNPVYFLHIPKTAGSSINRLFESAYGTNASQTHIESKSIFSHDGCATNLEQYRFISGHYPYPFVTRNIELKSWTTICTFRRPLEHVASHLCWVRLLAEPGHESRLSKHEKGIQQIAKFFGKVDFSSAGEITKMIDWLAKNNFYLFHNTQTRYLCGGKPGSDIPPQLLQQALQNLDTIDYAGIVERFDEFILMLIGEFNLNVSEDVLNKQNPNSERFGIDITKPDICKALEPLIAYDNMIYSIARNRYIDHLHAFLAKLEKGGYPRFTTVNTGLLKKTILTRN